MLSLLLVAALGTLTPNSQCPVTGKPVANHLLYHTVTVNGRAYYVYDREAANRLRSCPECYLTPEGQPINSLATRPCLMTCLREDRK
jgi:YHS domain-containing protein